MLKNLEGQPVGISGVGRNVSERKKLEEQLLQAQKMEVVGQLAGGIAHDFNNILSAIMGYGSLLQIKMGKDFPFIKYVDEIMKSAERAAQLTASLLAFSRKQHIILRPIDLNDLVRDIHKLLSRIIGEDIELELKLSDYPLIIMGDKVQIEHAVINIATNARDAMPDGGRMTIMARRHRHGEDFINIHGIRNRGDFALLSIADNGTGMDDASKEKIFEPFFTTKEVGKGTGLGLSMVYGTIKQHKGYIDVESFPGEGTAFNIYLPMSESNKETNQQEPPVPQSSPNASEIILLVEDEGPVRQIMREILEQTGYRVIEAVDGEHALRELQQHRDAIHLLITDIIMPKMDGLTLCQKARAIKPGLKSLFISGYHDKILDSKGGRRTGKTLPLQTLHGRTVSEDGKRNVRQLKDRPSQCLGMMPGQLNCRQWTPRTTLHRSAVFLSYHDQQRVILVKKPDVFIEFTIKELPAFFIRCVHVYEAVPR